MSTNITASNEGVIGFLGFSVANWGTIRNATSGNFATTYTSDSDVSAAVQAAFEAARFGSSGLITRTFLFFDTSSITGTITAAQLQVAGYQAATGATVCVESTAWGGGGGTTTLTNAMYNDVDFSRTYSSQLATWSTSGYNTFTLNNNAISDMNSNSYLNVAIINSTYDQQNVAPSNTQVDNGIRFQDGSFPIRLVITSSAPGYEEDVIGVDSDDIAKIIGVETAAVELVIGV